MCWHHCCDVSVTLCNVSIMLSEYILYVHPRSDSTEFHGIGRGNSYYVCLPVSVCFYPIFSVLLTLSGIIAKQERARGNHVYHKTKIKHIQETHASGSNNTQPTNKNIKNKRVLSRNTSLSNTADQPTSPQRKATKQSQDTRETVKAK